MRPFHVGHPAEQLTGAGAAVACRLGTREADPGEGREDVGGELLAGRSSPRRRAPPALEQNSGFSELGSLLFGQRRGEGVQVACVGRDRTADLMAVSLVVGAVPP